MKLSNMIDSNQKGMHSVQNVELETETSTISFNNRSFHEGHHFQVCAKGIGAIRAPIPMTQRLIPVYDATGSVAYLSSKKNIWSASSVLSSPKQGDLVATEHTPGRCPQLRLLCAPPLSNEPEPTVELTTDWTSRAVRFAVPGPSSCLFEWRYIDRTVSGEKKTDKVLALEMRELVARQTAVVAYLARNADTRPEGSPFLATGDGGELVISSEVDPEHISEALIVATCLIMLRRERDRRRMIQAAVIAVGAGGN